MIIRILTAVVMVLQCTALLFADPPAHRTIACKTPANAASCYWTRGRLTYGNGTPALRLWKSGTRRLLGIYSGPSVNFRGEDNLDNEHPELPDNVARKVGFAASPVWADFEVCPLEPEKSGVMQPACIESAKNVFVEKLK